MIPFYYKIGLLKLPPIIESQNFKCIHLGPIILCLQTYQKMRHN